MRQNEGDCAFWCHQQARPLRTATAMRASSRCASGGSGPIIARQYCRLSFACQRSHTRGGFTFDLDPVSSKESAASENSDRRAVGNKCRTWMTLQNAAEFNIVQSGCITFKFCRSADPHLPRHMRNVVFQSLPSPTRITPIVFGHELFQTSFSW